MAKNRTFHFDIPSLMRSVIMLVLIALSLFVERENYYNSHFSLFVCIEIALVFLFAILMIDTMHKSKALRVEWFAIFFWGAFTLYTLASDILVDKQYRFSETGIFIAFFFFGCIWNSRYNAETYIKDFTRSIQWFLVFLVIVSLLFPGQHGIPGRYSGPINNPSVYALYLCSIWSILLGSLEWDYMHGASRTKKSLTIIELFITFILMVLSQSLTPMIALFAVTLIFLYRRIMFHKGKKQAIKSFLILGILLVAIVIVAVVWVRNLQNDTGSRLIEKLQAADISTFLSARDYYWRRYFREMNLFGHSKKPFLWDHRILPHNALIGMMYWYGVPCVVPYIIMMMMGIEKSFRFADTNVPYAAVPFYSIVSFVIMSMADNVEQPFVWLPWIACYLMMAPILIMPVEEIEALKSANAAINTEESEQI